MQIVIDIPEDMYYAIEHRYWSVVNETVLLSCVANGIPIPKGHGRLIDEDTIAGDGSWDWSDRLDATPTIIEADREINE